MKIICFGDSLTYGWDPREFSTNRYDTPWPKLLAEMTGHEVINLGQPGREIYFRDYQYRWFDNYVNADNHDLLIIMLGTNDILNTSLPRAEVPLERMKIFIRHIREKELSRSIVLMAPTRIGHPYREHAAAVLDYAAKLKAYAISEGLGFIDASEWDIPLAFDGIHMSEDAQQIFAQHVAAALEKL